MYRKNVFDVYKNCTMRMEKAEVKKISFYFFWKFLIMHLENVKYVLKNPSKSGTGFKLGSP